MFKVPSLTYDIESGNVLVGVRVRHAQAAGRGIVAVKRGKDPLSFEMYCRTCKEMMESCKRNAIFSHTVMTTMWNLMSRVENAINICKIAFRME